MKNYSADFGVVWAIGLGVRTSQATTLIKLRIAAVADIVVVLLRSAMSVPNVLAVQKHADGLRVLPRRHVVPYETELEALRQAAIRNVETLISTTLPKLKESAEKAGDCLAHGSS